MSKKVICARKGCRNEVVGGREVIQEGSFYCCTACARADLRDELLRQLEPVGTESSSPLHE